MVTEPSRCPIVLVFRLVVVGTTTETAAIETAARKISVVLAGTREPRLSNVDIAVNDDETGAWLATDHLIALGHRRIAHLRGPGDVSELRRAGYAAAMRTAGLNPAGYTTAGGMSKESGYAAARRLLSCHDRPTAIFAFNGIAAIGAPSAAAGERVNVPGELSLVGYDDTHLARIRHISLTSVDNGSFAVGVQAGKYLTERIEAPTLSSRLHSITSELHIRGSTGPAPSS
jgi:DNA-binding LacI/PurR family transcriptional regulator